MKNAKLTRNKLKIAPLPHSYRRLTPARFRTGYVDHLISFWATLEASCSSQPVSPVVEDRCHYGGLRDIRKHDFRVAVLWYWTKVPVLSLPRQICSGLTYWARFHMHQNLLMSKTRTRITKV
jgi:hypothetical protein